MNLPFSSNPDDILEELGQLSGQEDLAKRAEAAYNAFEGQPGDAKEQSDDAGDADSDSGDDDSDSGN